MHCKLHERLGTKSRTWLLSWRQKPTSAWRSCLWCRRGVACWAQYTWVSAGGWVRVITSPPCVLPYCHQAVGAGGRGCDAARHGVIGAGTCNGLQAAHQGPGVPSPGLAMENGHGRHVVVCARHQTWRHKHSARQRARHVAGCGHNTWAVAISQATCNSSILPAAHVNTVTCNCNSERREWQVHRRRPWVACTAGGARVVAHDGPQHPEQ